MYINISPVFVMLLWVFGVSVGFMDEMNNIETVANMILYYNKVESIGFGEYDSD